MTLEFSELAQTELEDARTYYNLQQEELGERFQKKYHLNPLVSLFKIFKKYVP